ncbi:MAG: MtaA/CmuA family methyltransferase [Candidatus Hecatellales archaeon B24]|nr:MAG: MtaA/CmuA family methyltransferase [Candidatus Hecatellales archaeon B24]
MEGTLNSYERVMLALEGKSFQADRAPYVNPTITATLEFMEATGARWPEAHRNPELMAELASAGPRLAGLDMLTVPFDFMVEAEVLGAPIDFMEEPASRGVMVWPMVKTFTVKEPSDVKPPRNVGEAGRIPVITRAIRLLKSKFEGLTPVNVVMNAPFTCVGYYLVNPAEFMKALITDPEKIGEILEASVEAFIGIAQAYEEAGADVITFHDMGASTAVIAPQHFKAFAAPHLKSLAKAVKCKTILSICGPNLKIIREMVEVGADAIALDERTSILEARKLADETKRGYPIAGNISPRLLAAGSLEEISNAVRKAISEGVDLVAPGCDLLLQTPTRNLKAAGEAVEKYGGRSPPFR